MPPARPPRSRAIAASLALACLLVAPPAWAGTEEFETFSVERQEVDDEALLDHMLARMPLEWRADWERNPLAFRTSQGCLTSGQWLQRNEVKLYTPVGSAARFGFTLLQDESDALAYQYIDLAASVPTRWGAPGVYFRPFFYKSRQDFGVTWETGNDSTGFQALARFTFEDTFNNLWAFRQTQVGENSEPYERHPYEPSLALADRAPTWRYEISGHYLTPSVKRVSAMGSPVEYDIVSLWGTYGRARVEVDVAGTSWALATENRQATSTLQPGDYSTADNRDFRRQWSLEASARRSMGRSLIELRGIYQDRTQSLGAPAGPRTFSGIDRAVQLDALVPVRPSWSARLGAMLDRIDIEQNGVNLPFSYGSRTESRLYAGITASFGRLQLQVVEGIELNAEPYDVWGLHDKAFLQLQAAF